MAEPAVKLHKGWTDMEIITVLCLYQGSKDKILGLDHDSQDTGQITEGLCLEQIVPASQTNC